MFFAISCKQLTETEKLQKTLIGNWLVIAPDHHLKSGEQKWVYSQKQDSIVQTKSLKLISLSKHGIFRQVDSKDKKGRWGTTEDNRVFIEKGGTGFQDFNADFKDYKNGLLLLSEFIEVDDEKIEVVWNLKKVSGKTESKLFDNEKNQWRIKPTLPETEKQMKQRLSVMLQYYSDYFSLVTKEASFFIPARVILPFNYYQHAMGIKPFDENSDFAGLFFSKEQAGQGWRHLKTTYNVLKDEFPKKKNYVEEYAAFMEMMANQLRRNEP
jgi:hypothetical protein